MNNFIKSFVGVILLMTAVSCGSGSRFEGQFSGDELKAVKITQKSLPRGARIEDCRVVKAKLPLALMEPQYKSVRDKAFKARLDYRSCITRGLEAAAQKNEETLAEIQNLICDKSESLESTSPEYLFVLAKVKEPSAIKEGLYGYIGVFDIETMEKVDIIQVTTPLYNNAVMVTEALNGTLSNPMSNGDTTSLKVENPIVEFILGCTPK